MICATNYFHYFRKSHFAQRKSYIFREPTLLQVAPTTMSMTVIIIYQICK